MAIRPPARSVRLPRGRGAVLALVLACAGCGDETAPLADASLLPDAVCPLPEGRLYVMSAFAIEGPGLGFDLDGDGTIDNAIGELPNEERANLNGALDLLRENGLLLAGIYLTGWSDPPTADDADVVAHLVQLTDADRDLSNNLGGEGTFYIDKNAFDLNCNPASAAEETTLVDGQLSARRSFWTFLLGTIATLEMADARLAFQFDADFRAATGQGGAIVTACSLAEMPYPSDPSSSVIDKLVNDPSVPPVTMDMDRDGDGLEQIVGDGVDIVECIDGDGTRIPGASCPCHPAIADGYSIAVDLPLVAGTAERVL